MHGGVRVGGSRGEGMDLWYVGVGVSCVDKLVYN